MPLPIPRGASRRAVPALVVLLIGATLAGCGAGSKATGDKGYVDGQGVITRLAPAEREPVDLDRIAGRTLQGKPISIKDFAGRTVVVNVWASWCAPCRAESPSLVRAAEHLGDKVDFLGIDVRDPGSTSASLAFERRFKVNYPSIYDPSGRTLLAFRGKVSPFAIPSTLVIDRNGKVAASILGSVPSTRTLVDLVSDVDRSTR